MTLFEHEARKNIHANSPLASRMRPLNLDEFIGQNHLTGEEAPLKRSIERGLLPSMILWGPPGTGKTTLANLVTLKTNFLLVKLSAVTSGVSDLRKLISAAGNRLGMSGQRTVLFIDEIHRFNKAQQDVILPFIEDGTITFIGATTENPSFEIIPPLLSRCRVFSLNALIPEDIIRILTSALNDKIRGLGEKNLFIEEAALKLIADLANGDARRALNTLELAADVVNTEGNSQAIGVEEIRNTMETTSIPHDKHGDRHYDTISAFIKSVRASDPDAAVYWLARLLSAGENLMYIARRLVILASEDIGLADPRALALAVSTQQAIHFVGLPEARIILSEATIYLASAPKSNTAYEAINSAMSEVALSGDQPVPLHLRNPVTELMSNEGYGTNYKYAHNYPGHFVRTENLPKNISSNRFYYPENLGYERSILDRLRNWWGDESE